MKKTLTLLLTLVALTGCVGVKPTETSKPVTMPPMPPGYTPKAEVLRSPKAAMAAPMVMAAEAPSEPEPWTMEKLYITQKPDGIYLEWLYEPTNRYVLLSTTNLMTPVIQWYVLSTACKTLSNDVASIQITNRSAPMRFYKLMTVPVNSLVFGWTYDFNLEPTVTGFNLYEGPASRTYTNHTGIIGQYLWNVHGKTGTNVMFYTLTAVANGLESDLSNEVRDDQPHIECP